MPRVVVRRSRQRGSALIEFALVAFLLLLVMFAAIELDRMLFVYTSLADAAKAGARYAIVHGNDRLASGAAVDGPSGPGDDPAQVLTSVQSYTSLMINTAALTVHATYPDGTNTTASQVKVLVQYVYDPWTVLPLGVTLSATSEGIIS